MQSWKEFKKELLKDPEVKKEYDKLQPRYAVISAIIEARVRKGLTQKELASRIGTKQSNIARLESGNGNPSLSFLERMASAMGYKLNIRLH